MNQDLLKKIEASSLRKEPINFSVGDTVKVHVKVVEGDKERIQVFAGIVIARRGSGEKDAKEQNSEKRTRNTKTRTRIIKQ